MTRQSTIKMVHRALREDGFICENNRKVYNSDTRKKYTTSIRGDNLTIWLPVRSWSVDQKKKIMDTFVTALENNSNAEFTIGQNNDYIDVKLPKQQPAQRGEGE